ncbi:MAG: hypothetical protein QXS21_00435 [Thermoproteota archaeon]|nr:hypothetical protein [Candidatus Brockarchaeota archaeon]MBO3800874.1 hypothetical protein [Candidatus Brockarchaeota archaeon]
MYNEKLENEIKKISSVPCKLGGWHELVVEKSEEYPDGTIKYILVCKKCKEHFEVEVY